MADNNETLPPANRKSGTWTRITEHARKKNGGWKVWAASIFGGLIILTAGGLLLVFVPSVPWYVGAPTVIVGLQIGSRGAFAEAMRGLKDVVIEIIRAKRGE